MQYLLILAFLVFVYPVAVQAQMPPTYQPVPPSGWAPVYYAPRATYQVQPRMVWVRPQPIRPTNPTGYQNRPYYGAYGYGNVSNGSTDGFPPFRGRRAR